MARDSPPADPRSRYSRRPTARCFNLLIERGLWRGLVMVCLAACGMHGPAGPGDSLARLEIRVSEVGLEPPWTLVDESGVVSNGEGAATVDSLSPGTYQLLPGFQPGWLPPHPAVIDLVLTAGESASAVLEYAKKRRVTAGFAVSSPTWSEDGTRVAFLDERSGAIVSADVSTGDTMILLGLDGDYTSPSWSRDGTNQIALLRVEESAVYTFGVDADALDTLLLDCMPLDQGSPSDLSHCGSSRELVLAIDDAQGSNVYLVQDPGRGPGSCSYLFDGSPGNHATIRGPKCGPSGDRIAYARIDRGFGQIHVWNARTENSSAVSDGISHDVDPDWDPRGTYLCMASTRPGKFSVYIADASTVGVPTRVTFPDHHEDADREPVWSPDGQIIAFSRLVAGDRDLWIVAVPKSYAAP